MAFFKVKVERVNGNDFLAYAYRYDLLCQKASGYEMNVIFIGILNVKNVNVLSMLSL